MMTSMGKPEIERGMNLYVGYFACCGRAVPAFARWTEKVKDQAVNPRADASSDRSARAETDRMFRGMHVHADARSRPYTYMYATPRDKERTRSLVSPLRGCGRAPDATRWLAGSLREKKIDSRSVAPYSGTLVLFPSLGNTLRECRVRLRCGACVCMHARTQTAVCVERETAV